MIIEKITRLEDQLNAQGEVIGQIEKYHYKVYEIEAAIDENNNPVNIKVLKHTISEQNLINKYNTAKARRDEALAEMNRLKAYWDYIKTL